MIETVIMVTLIIMSISQVMVGVNVQLTIADLHAKDLIGH